MALDVQWLRSKDRHAVTSIAVSNLRSPSPPLAAFFLSRSGTVMKLHILPTICFVLFLSACAGNMQSYSKFDERQKTITVPYGSSGLKGGMKKALTDRGWKMAVYSGPEILEGTSGSSVRMEKYRTFNTRYTLLGTERNTGPAGCFISQYFIYDIAIVDNKTGQEVMTMSGEGCEGQVLDTFGKALDASSQ